MSKGKATFSLILLALHSLEHFQGGAGCIFDKGKLGKADIRGFDDEFRALSAEEMGSGLYFGNRVHHTSPYVAPLADQLPCAVYRVTARGNARQPIVQDDTDRQRFVATLAAMVAHYQMLCHAWVLMDNHYHFVLETPQTNLSS